MAEAVARLKELSADERERMLADARDKWLWDQSARERKSREEGEAKSRAEIAGRMVKMKMSVADIAAATGLSEAEVERLSTAE